MENQRKLLNQIDLKERDLKERVKDQILNPTYFQGKIIIQFSCQH